MHWVERDSTPGGNAGSINTHVNDSHWYVHAARNWPLAGPFGRGEIPPTRYFWGYTITHTLYAMSTQNHGSSDVPKVYKELKPPRPSFSAETP